MNSQIKGGDAVGGSVGDHCLTPGETLATAKSRLMNAFNANMKKTHPMPRANVANVNNYNTLNTQNPNMNNNKLNNNKNNNNKTTTITGTSTTSSTVVSNAGKLSKTPAQLPASTGIFNTLKKTLCFSFFFLHFPFSFWFFYFCFFYFVFFLNCN